MLAPRRAWPWLPLAALLAAAAPLPSLAQAGGQVICDVKVMRLVHTLKDKAEAMSAQELDTARRALYKAISECRPMRSSHSSSRSAAQIAADSDGQKVIDTAEQDRQSLRMQQNDLTKPQLREGERRLDAIEHKARTDPYTAREMQKLNQIDQSRTPAPRPPPDRVDKDKDRGKDKDKR